MVEKTSFEANLARSLRELYHEYEWNLRCVQGEAFTQLENK